MSSELFNTHPLYAYAVVAVLVTGLFGFCVQMFVSAPYGRHAREGWGPVVKARTAWIVMEAPSPICFAVVYFMSGNWSRSVPVVLFCMYMAHYVYRAFIYPFRMRAYNKNKPVLTSLLAFMFNIVNGSTNAFAITELAPHLWDTRWFAEPQFVVGVLLFIAGYSLNHQSDTILRSLRKSGETGYRIPHGGLYRWVSSPNYLAELIEWTGFAMAAATIPAWAFVWFGACTLVPRSLSHHKWYHERFEDYPPERRALIPYVL